MMLITAYSERQTRHREKIERLLNFLAEFSEGRNVQ